MVHHEHPLPPTSASCWDHLHPPVSKPAWPLRRPKVGVSLREFPHWHSVISEAISMPHTLHVMSLSLAMTLSTPQPASATLSNCHQPQQLQNANFSIPTLAATSRLSSSPLTSWIPQFCVLGTHSPLPLPPWTLFIFVFLLSFFLSSKSLALVTPLNNLSSVIELLTQIH